MTSPIEELREALAKAQPGPWLRSFSGAIEHVLHVGRMRVKNTLIRCDYPLDSVFMVAARNHLPALLAEYDRMAAELAQAKAASVALSEMLALRSSARKWMCEDCGASFDTIEEGREHVNVHKEEIRATARRNALIEAADFVAGRRDQKGNLAAFAITANHLRKMAEGEPT